MNTLWSFGPSVAQLTDYRNNNNLIIEEQWINQVANKLNLKHYAFGLAGTSIEYTYKKFYDCKKEIENNDVIIVVTSPIYDRHWFFEDRPKITSINDPGLTKDESMAMKQWMMHLDKNNSLKKVYLYNFLESLHNTTVMKNCTTLLIPAWEDEQFILNEIKNDFPNIYTVNDNLVTIITSEFDNKYTKNQVLDIVKEDKRFCHMIKSNHTILANKLINYIENKVDIDFNSDFITNVINDEFQKTDNSNELFGMNWFK